MRAVLVDVNDEGNRVIAIVDIKNDDNSLVGRRYFPMTEGETLATLKQKIKDHILVLSKNNTVKTILQNKIGQEIDIS